jgi:hypothetical protein
VPEDLSGDRYSLIVSTSARIPLRRDTVAAEQNSSAQLDPESLGLSLFIYPLCH